MDVHMDECSQNHKVLVSRTEDLEDDMQIVKTDVNVMKIEMSSYQRDVDRVEASMKDVESSIDNAHFRLEKVEDCVDGMVSSIRSISSLSASNAHALGLEIQKVQGEGRMQLDGFFKKFERMNEILDKKSVHMDEELDRVMALVGEKIDVGLVGLKAEFQEALEAEGRRYGILARDLELVKSYLKTAQVNNEPLVLRLSNFQIHLTDIEDAVMESSDAEGEPSDSSSDLEPVENMVAIPVPGPSVITTLIPVDSKYIPPVLRVTPSPLYVAEQSKDPAHGGVLEFWAESSEEIVPPLCCS
jgi:chromosome segregation ATPase